MERRRRILLFGSLVAVWAVAVAARWPALPVAVALGDAAGPYWSAARPTGWPPPHAAIYGGALAAPHRLALQGAGSLWESFAALFAVQALVAPVAGALAWRLGGRLLPAAVVGLLVAVDPGLLDTTVSGSKAYLAPLWLGVAALCAGRRAAPLAPLAFALAVANHPLSLCAAPLLALLPRTRWTAGAALAAAALLVPQALRVAGAESGGGAPGLAAPVEAVSAWVDSQGGSAVAIVGGLVAGLAGRRTRPLAAATAGSLALLLLAGGGLGYLRDHHLRLLTLPAVAGLAALPAGWGLLPLLLLRAPVDPVTRPAEARRPGTLGLETRIATALEALPVDRLVVDGVWISGAPAAEPGAVLLDLLLRGRPIDALAPGGAVALIVTAERPHLAALPPAPALTEVLRDDRVVILVGESADTRAWVQAVCAAQDLPAPRVGGAWDGLAFLHPTLGAEVGEAWAPPCAP